MRVCRPLQLVENSWGPGVEAALRSRGHSRGHDARLRVWRRVKLVGVATFEDFKAAADRVFAQTPLQEEHPDWLAEIRASIAARRLLPGMTKRQTFYVTGVPESSREVEQDGKKVEERTMRRFKGAKFSFWSTEMGNPMGGAPETLRFVDGAVADFTETSSGALNLDD